MEEKSKAALKMLSENLHLLQTVRNEVKLMQQRFSPLAYFKKTFKMNIDAPSLIPISESSQFIIAMHAHKESLLLFKESFNENDLPGTLAKEFLSIFLLVTQKSLDIKKDVVYLGDGDIVWYKPIPWVIKNWETMGYQKKVIYSKEAYDLVSSYFDLINSIEEFCKKVDAFFL